MVFELSWHNKNCHNHGFVNTINIKAIVKIYKLLKNIVSSHISRISLITAPYRKLNIRLVFLQILLAQIESLTQQVSALTESGRGFDYIAKVLQLNRRGRKVSGFVRICPYLSAFVRICPRFANYYSTNVGLTNQRKC